MSQTSLDRTGLYYCDLCQVKIYGIDNYGKHLVGKVHLKNFHDKNDAFNLRLLEDDLPDVAPTPKPRTVLLRPKEDEGSLVNIKEFHRVINDRTSKIPSSVHDDSSSSSQYFCKICVAHISGHDNYQLHLVGKQHLKNLNRHSDTSDIIILNYRAYCRICQVYIDGEDNSHLHLKGCQHLRGKILPDLVSGAKNESFMHLQNLSSYKICALCNVPCSGDESWKAHIVGRKHKFAQTKYGIFEAPFLPFNDRNTKFFNSNVYCFVCQVDCNNLGNYQAHMDSDRHMRRVKSTVLLKTD